jgi:hypothetical protein
LRVTCGGAILAARFTLPEIIAALQGARLKADVIHAVTRTLKQFQRDRLKRRGRKKEDDELLLAKMAAHVRAGNNRWQAADIATRDLKEPAKTAARKRIYRKFIPE